MKQLILAIFALVFLCVNNAYCAQSTWHENQSKGAQVRLIGSLYQSADGSKKLIAGLNFSIASGWKIYGSGSEGIGMPPHLDFKGSTNYLNHTMVWPKPQAGEEKIGKETIKYPYYSDEITLPIEIDLKDATQPTNLVVQVNYGLCKDICVPVTESFSLEITDKIDGEALGEIQKFYPQKIIQKSTKIIEQAKQSYSIALISAVVLALFGGAILNIMPCVLPILSIKLISLVKHSGSEISKIRWAFLSTILGILSCFIVFAFCAFFIKLTGNSLGWGLQFQNPYFLIFLVVILVFFIGNLLGIFEITFNQILATFINKKISTTEKQGDIFIANFLSGVLAVLLATPCSAPFLGSAISFALIQDFSIIMLIFLCLGIGFASPYIILSILPRLVYLLPKPGMWMLKVKQLMAGLLAATAIWLVYILSHNIGTVAALIVGIFSVLLLTSLRIKSYFLKFFTIVIIATIIFSAPTSFYEKRQITRSEYDRVWKEFDEVKISQLVAQGKVVVVDITADWCLTCKYNKFSVLADEEVVEKLKDDNIVAMRGDITKPNPDILDFLHRHHRFAIPFNAVYGPNAKMGLLTKELLNKKELLEFIDEAS